MRRPVIFLFLSFTFGIALQYLLVPEPFFLALSAIFIAAVYFFSWKKEWGRKWIRRICIFALVTLLGCFWFFLAENAKDPLEAQVGESCMVEGRIITVQIKDETSCQMLITSKDSGKRLIQVKGAMGKPAGYIGKWVSVKGSVELPSARRNPGLFDYQLYLKTKGVRVIVKTDSSNVIVNNENCAILPSMIARLKYGFTDRLQMVMSPEAFGMMVGMLFGDRSFISDDTYEAFQKNGVAHILSVSGIHVAIVYLYIGKLLGNRKTKAFYGLAAALLIFYAALSEFSPSVVRAVVMIAIHMFSKVSYRRYDFISCTAGSAMAMLICNPFYLFNTGFQLSYMAVFCLSAVIPWANRKIDSMEEKGIHALWVEGLRWSAPLMVIQMGMAPLTAYLFNYFSIVSFFINTPIILISGFIIPLGIGLIPLSFLGGIPFGVGAQAAELLTNAMIWLNDLFFLPGVGFFNLVSPSIYMLVIFYVFFFFLTSEFLRILYQRRKHQEIAWICILLVFLSGVSSYAADSGYEEEGLVFLDVGQGDCLIIRTPEGKTIMIDGGGSLNYNVGEKTLLPYLLKSGVDSVDLAIVTHLHDDHYLGIKELAENFEIKKFGTYEANRLREKEIMVDTGLDKSEMLYLVEGDRIKIEKDIWIDVLYPRECEEKEYEELIQEEKDENLSSLFLKVNYKGLTVLMTGDLGVDGENQIMSFYQERPEVLEADILKVGHHGSRYSTGDLFLAAVSPKIAVFQVGKNNFGHPHPTIIEKCKKKGIIIYRNDLNGAIIFEEEDQQWHIKVLLQKNMRIKK